MKRYLICGLIALLVLSSIDSSAQRGRHGRSHGRSYGRSYYPQYRYPIRSSVSVIARLPFGAVSLSFGNRYYHYYNGYYYQPYNFGYRMVPPPIGIVVPVLPPGAVHVIIGSGSYYRYRDGYYAPYEREYRVVEEPKDEETSTVTTDDKSERSQSSEYEKIILEGKTFYKKGDKYYKASLNKDGEIVYEEVGQVSNK